MTRYPTLVIRGAVKRLHEDAQKLLISSIVERDRGFLFLSRVIADELALRAHLDNLHGLAVDVPHDGLRLTVDELVEITIGERAEFAVFGEWGWGCFALIIAFSASGDSCFGLGFQLFARHGIFIRPVVALLSVGGGSYVSYFSFICAH